VRAQLAAIKSVPALAPEERRLAGLVTGLLYTLGGASLASFLVLPGISHAHGGVLLGIAAVSVIWGLACSRAIDWEGAPPSLIQLSSSAGLALIAVAIASSGGASSPAWVYLFFVAVFAAYFYSPPIAALYLAACVLTQLLALGYDPRALHGASLAQLVIAAAAYIVLGGAIVAGKQLLWTMRSRAEALAAEQGALRRVATAVVGGDRPERIYELLAIEVAQLLGAGAAGILRFDTSSQATVIGSWADHEGGRYTPGTTVEVATGSDLERARTTGVPVRLTGHEADSPVGRLGYSSSVVAPVNVAGKSCWGALAATSTKPFTLDDEQRLMAFGDLLATAIASIEDRAKLAAQASTDPLTGLANHRSLQQAVAREVARAVRHGRPLSIAVIDVDHFKHVNDTCGHDAGDEILVRVADCLRNLARAGDTLGRSGGDELAWVLPETHREQALLAVERARRVIASTVMHPVRVTVSAGICDTSVTVDPAQLIRFADGALYWSKAHGRDQSWIYDPEIVSELSAQERAERLERSHALVGLRALARAIDAKDPATSRHSERVAELAGKLARAVGWLPERARLLSEAALVHDVGKIAVPDTVLRKSDPLTAAEREQIKAHAELAARIVEDVLAPEQVEWIRTHHERPDGSGYPDGLVEDEIPEGAALLALADAWDVMTVNSVYSRRKPMDEALTECEELIGRQFTATAVRALIALHSRGELTDPDLLELEAFAASVERQSASAAPSWRP
jgi:diguanylate cyclase (GGDEF)-like protein/putative nucleotidyltransferase with HDIG domain